MTVVECLVCQRESARHGCDDCCVRLARCLRDIETYTVLVLPHMTMPVRGQTGRMSPGYGSRSPARDDIIAAFDPRSGIGAGEPTTLHPDDVEDPIRYIPGFVIGVAEGIAGEREELPPVTFGGSLDYIRKQLGWSAAQPWFDELANDILRLHRKVRELAGDRPQKPLGECLNVTCDGTVRWGGPGKPARCGDCKRTYDGLDLVRLGVAEETAA